MGPRSDIYTILWPEIALGIIEAQTNNGIDK